MNAVTPTLLADLMLNNLRAESLAELRRAYDHYLNSPCHAEAGDALTILAMSVPVLLDIAEREAELRAALEALIYDVEISTERWGDGDAGPATVPLEPGPLPVSEEVYDQARAALARLGTEET